MHRLVALSNRLPKGVRRVLKRVPGVLATRDAMMGNPSGPVPRTGEPRAVVYLPTWATWDEMRQRPQYLMEAFADAGHPAYFVDPREPQERTVGNVTIVPSIASTPPTNVILYVHFAPNRTLFDRYEDPVIVYDILDDLSIYDADEVGMPPERTVRHHHAPVVADADLVIASSPELIASHRHERDDIVLVENGVSTSRFADAEPEDLGLGDRRVVGYHGMIARWFDFTLLESVADQSTDLNFVLVGPVAPESEADLARLAARPNVVHLGPVASDDIGSYVAAFDVGIVPFVVDDLTRSVSPLKMYEYMAAGVPVVGTPLPACESDPFVATASTVEGFVDALGRAANTTDDRRMELRQHASEHRWDTRVVPVLDALDARGARFSP